MKDKIISCLANSEIQKLCDDFNNYVAKILIPQINKLKEFGKEIIEQIAQKKELSQENLDEFRALRKEAYSVFLDVSRLGNLPDYYSIIFRQFLGFFYHRVSGHINVEAELFELKLGKYIEDKPAQIDIDIPFKKFTLPRATPEGFELCVISLPKLITKDVWPELKALKKEGLTFMWDIFRTPEASDIKVISNIHKEVIVELVRNAILAMPEGGKILITLEKRGNDSVLTIKDEGKGIPEKNLDKITQKNFTTRSETGGTGLGLYLAKTYIEELLKGKLEIKSKEGKGTTVSIVLKCEMRN